MRRYHILRWPVLLLVTSSLFSCGGRGSEGPVGGDSEVPVLSNISNTITLPAESVSTTLKIGTDTNATCRYAKAPDIAYETMPEGFSITGNTIHSTIVNGLSNGKSFSFYVRCKKSGGGVNLSDFPVTFHVDSGGAYVPPIGIPAPSFGIEETHMMYDGLLYDYDGDGVPDDVYGDAGNGPYTHYIDINAANCSDSDEFGTLSNPRCSLPSGSQLNAGAVVEIHGGVYIPNSTEYRIISSGTVDKPIFFRGISVNDKAVFERVLRIRGAYIIVENIEFNKNQRYESAVDIRPDTNVGTINTVHHVSLRYCEALNFYNQDHQITNAGAFIGATTYAPGDTVHDIVYYRNKIHPDSISIYNSPDSFEADYHCVGMDGHSEDIWILENEIYNCTGDLIGNGNSANHTGKRYYIGRNNLYSAGENAIDVKEIDTVIISENTIHDFQGPSSGSDGTALVFHYGASNPKVSAKDIWVINNEIYAASDKAIQIGGDQQYPVYVVGNLIHDINNPSKTGTAIASWSAYDIYVTGNTIYNIDKAIAITGDSTHKLFLHNNLISNVTVNGKIFDLGPSYYLPNVTMDYNLFYKPYGTVSLTWGNEYTLPDFKTTIGKCLNCIEGVPLFVDALSNDFSLKTSSPALDTGMNNPDVYTIFQDLFGRDIRQGIIGNPRPQGAGWNIGAYEAH